MDKQLTGRAVVSGQAKGSAVVSNQPISFWGGVDPRTGEVIDRRHERSGEIIAGKVFVFPTGKGSSTGSAVLLESIKNGVAPAAIINVKLDAILALGAILAEEMYQRTTPIVILSQADFDSIHDRDTVEVYPDGTVILHSMDD